MRACVRGASAPERRGKRGFRLREFWKRKGKKLSNNEQVESERARKMEKEKKKSTSSSLKKFSLYLPTQERRAFRFYSSSSLSGMHSSLSNMRSMNSSSSGSLAARSKRAYSSAFQQPVFRSRRPLALARNSAVVVVVVSAALGQVRFRFALPFSLPHSNVKTSLRSRSCPRAQVGKKTRAHWRC